MIKAHLHTRKGSLRQQAVGKAQSRPCPAPSRTIERAISLLCAHLHNPRAQRQVRTQIQGCPRRDLSPRVQSDIHHGKSTLNYILNWGRLLPGVMDTLWDAGEEHFWIAQDIWKIKTKGGEKE